jgi:hypothetical protein
MALWTLAPAWARLKGAIWTIWSVVASRRYTLISASPPGQTSSVNHRHTRSSGKCVRRCQSGSSGQIGALHLS